MTPRFTHIPRLAALSVVVTLLAAPIASAQTITAAPPDANAGQTAAKALANTADAETTRPLIFTHGVRLAPGTSFRLAPKAQGDAHYKRNGALIGLASGATLVLATGASECADDGTCGPIIVLSAIFGGIGAAVGAGVGALLEPNDSGSGPLVVGKKVRITMVDGTSRTGQVVAISPAGIMLGPDQGTLAPRDQILRVSQVTHRVEKGALIGLAMGVGSGFIGLLAAGCGDESNCTAGEVMGWNIAIGVGAGVAIGAFMNRTHRDADLYSDVGRRTTTMAFAPILSPTRQGMAFSMTWR